MLIGECGDKGVREFRKTASRVFFLLVLLFPCIPAIAQKVTVSGTVVDDATGSPVEFASLLIEETGQWAVSDDGGHFTIGNVGVGKLTLTVQCLGYQKRALPMTLTRDVPNLRLKIKQESLRLSEVTVTAKRKRDEATTSYTIDRAALDQQQLLNVGDIGTLLPGGKTVNPSLMADNRMALRSGSSEKGNASFGTAIEVDGQRIDNNAMMGETTGASTRTVSASDIASIEIVTGIPSVEYGDLSNGIVKVNTRRGKSPFIVEGKVNQHTRQIALNKGFQLSHRGGVLNMSVEHARSFSDAASPYTAYQRNILSLHYMNVFMSSTMPLTLNAGLTGNIGGYNSEADPDEELDDYTKTRDNALRANVELNWLLNRKWLTNVQLRGSLSYSDRKTESYTHASSASTQPYIHTTSEGYFIARDYDDMTASGTDPMGGIVLGPVGYWYVRQFNDSKPLSWNLRLKGEQNSILTIAGKKVRNHLMVGADYSGSHNEGRGTYYDDMRYAPTWREYRYDELPSMHNVALFAEDKISLPTAKLSTLEITAGLRDDITMVGGSDYGTVSSLSPRLNGRYIFWQNRRKRSVSDLQMHAGWGKSVKLPSFQVLYPAPGYTDRLAFSSASSSNNTSFYAYHTQPTRAFYNSALQWQYTNQTDIGVEATVMGTRIMLSAFHHKTFRPYMSASRYTRMSYRYTSPGALETDYIAAIAQQDRRYDIDQQGLVTVTNTATGVSIPLDYLRDPQQNMMVVGDKLYQERNTYTVNNTFVNADPISRYGLEWIVDFAKIKPLSTTVRIDGNYYYYKGTDETLFADIPHGTDNTMKDGRLYQYVGWYRGSSVTSAGIRATASVANGMLQKQLNMNVTVTTHIPKIRMIISLRLESSLYNYRRSLSELSDGLRGYVLASNGDFIGEPYDGSSENRYVAVYPEYYSTWEQPDVRLPFADTFREAYQTMKTAPEGSEERAAAQALYDDLSKLVVRTNYPYTMNADRLSSYYSANLSVTKEIGDHISLSFYANNFFRNMKTVNSSQTGLDTSLFGSSYIPSYYYGLSMRLKL